MLLGVLQATGAAAGETNGLTEITLDELMRVKVFSVAKHLQPRFEAPAAVHVITGEDIRRSGATSIPEALRMVPGLSVARVNLHAWAVSSRGFHSLFSDKLLVMIDGRSAYTPAYSGVWWNAQEILLEDVDRIEVVRGVDGTVWGANAVNGVINIITKPARATQGAYVTAGGGNEEQGFGAVRYGGKFGDETWFRVYAKGFNRVKDSELADAVLRAQQGRAGFRLDREVSANQMTLQGDYFNDVSAGVGVFPDVASPSLQLLDISPFHTWGANLLGRWVHQCANGSQWHVQAYYDVERRWHDYAINEERHTGDLEFQHRLALGDRQELTWGGGYRISRDHFKPTLAVSTDPDGRTLSLYSAFVQDECVLVPARLRLTMGLRIEHNSYTGFEFQPNLRLAWTPTAQQTLWAAVSRAVRMPSRSDRDMRLNLAGPGMLAQLQGSAEFDSEQVIALEAGYRLALLESVLLDLSVFYNAYDDLRAALPGTPYLDGGVRIVPYVYGNWMDGHAYGGELAADWRPVPWYRARASYSLVQQQFQEVSPLVLPYNAEGDSPQNQFMLRQSLDLPGNVQLDFGVRYADQLATWKTPAYVAGDARVAWRPNRHWEIAIVGQHLFHGQHLEFGQNYMVASEPVQQSVYGQLTWRY